MPGSKVSKTEHGGGMLFFCRDCKADQSAAKNMKVLEEICSIMLVQYGGSPLVATHLLILHVSLLQHT